MRLFSTWLMRLVIQMSLLRAKPTWMLMPMRFFNWSKWTLLQMASRISLKWSLGRT